MYDTQKRVALAKERIAEYRRRQARRSIQFVCTVRSAVFVPSGNGRYGAEPADGCRGNVRGDPAA